MRSANFSGVYLRAFGQGLDGVQLLSWLLSVTLHTFVLSAFHFIPEPLPVADTVDPAEIHMALVNVSSATVAAPADDAGGTTGVQRSSMREALGRRATVQAARAAVHPSANAATAFGHRHPASSERRSSRRPPRPQAVDVAAAAMLNQGAQPPERNPPGRRTLAKAHRTFNNPSAPASAVRPRKLDLAPLFAPEPEYPEEARWEERTGSVTLTFAMAADGTVDQVDVQQSSGHRDLDQAAMQALRQWRFRQQDAALHPFRYHYAFHFRLY